MKIEGTIWKYRLSHGENIIEMPIKNRPLSTGWQEGEGLVLWAIVDPLGRKAKHRVNVYWTGEDGDFDYHRFLGTVQAPHGMVFHVFGVRLVV